MYHYLFTNDLRISTLEHSLKEAGQRFVTDTVPNANEDKSANNNMMTLGFYFNLIDASNCAKAAAKGNIRKVVLNFIKKFQYPNMRKPASYKESKDDGIALVPMRLILKLLYMISMSDGPIGYVKKEEIRDFIFYNDIVAKRKNPDVGALYQSIKLSRSSGVLPTTIDTDPAHRNWHQEDRQIREMIKTLLWSGCVVEDDEGNVRIQHDALSRSDEADIFEIVTDNGFWDGDSIESYRNYMDIEIEDDITINSTSDEINPYKLAGKTICNYVSSTGYALDISENDITLLYKEFNKKFMPEVLSKIPDEDLLKTIFYTAESTNDCLCYWLEFHIQNKKYFGSISGGSSFKFGLFQRKIDNVWITGSPTKQEELSDEDAIKLGKEIRDCLVKGAEIISAFATLNTKEEYEKLDDDLNTTIGKYASFAWIHKYFQMLFPTKFATWHSTEWQNHILYAYGIKPSDKFYGRSGQLSMIANYAKMSAVFFNYASFEKFGAIKQFCRIGTSDKTTNYFSEWYKNGIVAIGWKKIESLDAYLQGDDLNRKAIAEKLEEIYYPTDARTASRKSGELATFYRTTERTVFVAMDGETLLSLGDGIGAYSYDSDKEFAHYKTALWHNCFTSVDKLPNKVEGLLTSCITISNGDNLLYLYHKYYYEMREAEVDEEMKENDAIKRTPRTDLLHPLNQIIYGAPGTGKTYSSAEYALAIIEKRPINESQRTVEERKALMEKYESYVKNSQITFTTFHQSYGYEEFIQGIRPDAFLGSINFKKADGVFKKIADMALADTENNYVIIIDEINRGNISKIFGELITLIEEDKRFGELNQLTVTLPMGDTFAVPNNLYIIGTMNSADKSISLIDTALRRRFAFVEMAPDESIVEDKILRKVLTVLNEYLRKELRSTDLLIGHSFFFGKSENDLGNIMNQNIIPLLYEYFYDDEVKVKKALECMIETDYMIDSRYRGRIKIQKKV